MGVSACVCSSVPDGYRTQSPGVPASANASSPASAGRCCVRQDKKDKKHAKHAKKEKRHDKKHDKKDKKRDKKEKKKEKKQEKKERKRQEEFRESVGAKRKRSDSWPPQSPQSSSSSSDDDSPPPRRGPREADMPVRLYSATPNTCSNPTPNTQHTHATLCHTEH